MSVDGVPVNGGPMQIIYDATNGYTVTRVLTNLLESTKKWLSDEGMDLFRDDIAGGFALYAFDTQPDLDGNEYLSLKKQGNVRIDAHLNTALPHTVKCIVLDGRQGYFKIAKAVTSSWIRNEYQFVTMHRSMRPSVVELCCGNICCR